MMTLAPQCIRWTTAIVLLAAMFSMPVLTAGQDEAPRGLWLAGSGSEPVMSTNWGRLALRDGTLSFSATDASWQLPVADIRRADLSRQSNRILEIEGAAGEIYYVTIYGQQLLVESPRRALQLIQKAMRPAASRRE